MAVKTSYKMNVSLVKAEDVKKLTRKASEMPFEVQAGEGKYIVDAKSIMGMFSLNLSKPVALEWDATDHEDKSEEFKNFLSENFA